MSHTVYIALGSNLGERLANLKRAVSFLPPLVRPRDCSPVYETPPWGYTDQANFLNQVIRAETDLLPHALLDHLKSIETRLGREPAVRYGPRLIDLDILFYDDLILDSTRLKIPHPHLSSRAFVLVPLAAIAPQLSHPGLDLAVEEMLEQVDASGIRRIAPGDCNVHSVLGSSKQTQLGGSGMSEEANVKPLNWDPDPGVGYTVVRRPDGGMHYTFTDVSPGTLAHWREFALEHLLSSDRLTRNLYDLRQINEIPPEAVEYAVEVNFDPSSRNIRLAVVVAAEPVRKAIQEIADLTTPGGVEIGIFEDIEEAEAWLDRPLTLLV